MGIMTRRSFLSVVRNAVVVACGNTVVSAGLSALAGPRIEPDDRYPVFRSCVHAPPGALTSAMLEKALNVRGVKGPNIWAVSRKEYAIYKGVTHEIE